MKFLRALGDIILLVVAASLVLAAINQARASYILVCTDTRVIPTEVLFRDSFEVRP